MKKLNVSLYKAEKLGSENVPDVEINIWDQLPNFENLKKANRFYQIEAATLYGALRLSLPQATIHQLLILMLKGTENLYRGTLWTEK